MPEVLEHMSESRQMEHLEKIARALASHALEGISERDAVSLAVREFHVLPSQARLVLKYGEYAGLLDVDGSGVVRAA